MYGIDFLKRARELCSQYDVLLIFDEVATGFGRTGNRFVADLVLPDILVLGKALACSVALKSIELFEKQDYMSKIHTIENITRREMQGFSDRRIKEIRIMGGCVCIEVYDAAVLEGFQQFAYERGVFSRPF